MLVGPQQSNQSASFTKPRCNSYCCNPDNDAGGPWCFVQDKADPGLLHCAFACCFGDVILVKYTARRFCRAQCKVLATCLGFSFLSKQKEAGFFRTVHPRCSESLELSTVATSKSYKTDMRALLARLAKETPGAPACQSLEWVAQVALTFLEWKQTSSE